MRGKPNFSEAFNRDAVAQITERGYPVAEVSQRLGVSTHSLYAWTRQLAKAVSGDAGKDAEIRQLKRELAQVRKQVRNGMLSPVTFERQQVLKAEGV